MQTIIRKSTGEKFNPKFNLSNADFRSRIGFNPREKLSPSSTLILSDWEIEQLMSILTPVAIEKPATQTVKRDWRNDPATDAQLIYLTSLNIRLEPGMTKGRASQLIDAHKSGNGVGYVNGWYNDGSN